ncbi:helix-turn-helix domain-containing protein [Dongshaea marina]|uniref:helix-turn-helix domain-containing protein n=1 Tax=Dongshaea marina TaxID=2047966 RepID=UPI00131F17D3|nr:helix-turn-helix transcriptional regulator [Dongshaea marina]
MNKSNAQRKNNIIKNIDYLIKSRNETKFSFSERCGLTRTSLYKILDGKVQNVKHSTIERISDFFGVACDEIEYFDLEKIESQRKTISIDGNKNPAAVPIIPQSCFCDSRNKTIGQLVTEHPLTYIYDDASEVIAIRLEKDYGNILSSGEVIVVKRIPVLVDGFLALYVSEDKELIIKDDDTYVGFSSFDLSEDLELIGCIIEERF